MFLANQARQALDVIGVREAVEHLNSFQSIIRTEQVRQVTRPGGRMTRNIMNTLRLQINQIFQRGFFGAAAGRVKHHKVRPRLREATEEICRRLPNRIC